MFTVGSVDVMSTEYRSIFRWRTSTEYRWYVGGISVNCRWYVGQLSVAYRSTIGRISVVCHMYRSITGRYIGQVSANYRPSVGQVSARYRWPESYIGRHTYRPTIDWLSTDYPPSVDRVSTATSTDIAVDIAVDTTYSKHDPACVGVPTQGLCKSLTQGLCKSFTQGLCKILTEGLCKSPYTRLA